MGKKALAKAAEKVERKKASRAIAGHAESTVIRPVTAPRAKARVVEKTVQKEKEKAERAGCPTGTTATRAHGKAMQVTRAVAKVARAYMDLGTQTRSGQHWIHLHWKRLLLTKPLQPQPTATPTTANLTTKPNIKPNVITKPTTTVNLAEFASSLAPIHSQ